MQYLKLQEICQNLQYEINRVLEYLNDETQIYLYTTAQTLDQRIGCFRKTFETICGNLPNNENKADTNKRIFG